MIIDTDVLIWYLRGNENAKKMIYANIPFKISVINYLELIQGIENKKELKLLQNFINKYSIEIIHLNDNISARAMFLVEDYFLSHSLEIADAIIASTALENHEIILASNDKHYKFIPNLLLKKFKHK